MSSQSDSSSVPGDGRPASDSNENPDDAGGERPSREELLERVRELRAEVTRLKAKQADGQRSWVGRHPVRTLVLTAGVGLAAGYGLSRALQPRERRTLSERARAGLRRLSNEASRNLARLGEEWGNRAMEEGGQVWDRAAEAGKRLARESRAAGRETREGVRTASERVQRAGQGARETFHEATEEAGRRLRDVGESAAEEATKKAEQVDITGTGGDESSSWVAGSGKTLLVTVGGVAMAGYLVSKALRSF